MARIRTTKPEFWTSEQITECSVNARLMFLGMWNFCDDEGRHVASTKRLKMEVYPGDGFTDKQIRTWMNELIAQGLVLEYDVNPDDDKSQVVSYWQVTGWHHQKINRPQESKIPGPFHERSVNVHRAFTPEGKGREGKGIRTPRTEAKPTACHPILVSYTHYLRHPLPILTSVNGARQCWSIGSQPRGSRALDLLVLLAWPVRLMRLRPSIRFRVWYHWHWGIGVGNGIVIVIVYTLRVYCD